MPINVRSTNRFFASVHWKQNLFLLICFSLASHSSKRFQNDATLSSYCVIQAKPVVLAFSYFAVVRSI